MTTKKNSEQAAIAGVLNRLAKDNPLISTDQLQKKIKSEWKKKGLDKTFGRISTCSLCLRFKLSLGQEKKEVLVPIK